MQNTSKHERFLPQPECFAEIGIHPFRLFSPVKISNTPGKKCKITGSRRNGGDAVKQLRGKTSGYP